MLFLQQLVSKLRLGFLVFIWGFCLSNHCKIFVVVIIYEAKVEMKDLGSTKKIPAMEISRERARLFLCLSQKQYIEKIVVGLTCSGQNSSI